ncbi:hypothetical protein C8R45DRAFT_947283 [Mycena sanguinolenta]|nr:hypothetical protein C8R45DRAFT_947283 [Mycena sanguinolenta]
MYAADGVSFDEISLRDDIIENIVVWNEGRRKSGSSNGRNVRESCCWRYAYCVERPWVGASDESVGTADRKRSAAILILHWSWTSNLPQQDLGVAAEMKVPRASSDGRARDRRRIMSTAVNYTANEKGLGRREDCAGVFQAKGREAMNGKEFKAGNENVTFCLSESQTSPLSNVRRFFVHPDSGLKLDVRCSMWHPTLEASVRLGHRPMMGVRAMNDDDVPVSERCCFHERPRGVGSGLHRPRHAWKKSRATSPRQSRLVAGKSRARRTGVYFATVQRAKRLSRR